MKTMLLIISLLVVVSTFGQNDKYEADADYNARIGKYEEAIVLYDKILTQNDTSSYNYFLRGYCNYTINKHSKAVADFTKAINLYKSDIKGGWFVESRTIRTGEDKYKTYNKYISLEHKFIDSYFYRGLSKYALKDFRGALNDFSFVTKIDNSDANAYLNVGLCLIELNRHEEAILPLSTSIEIDNKFAYSYYLRGISLIITGKKEKGCSDLSKSGELGYEEAYNAINYFCIE